MITQTTRNNTAAFRVHRAARVARDARYDGLFFSRTSTTKIYCRSICPGKPALESNNIFFQSRTQAEDAGFRPCLRCRPELAPSLPIRNAAGWQFRNALGRIQQGLFPNKAFETQANSINAPPGQLPNDFLATIGTPLPKHWKAFQLGFAKMLLTDTAQSLIDITSITRFDNSQAMLDSLSSLYRRDPLVFRKPLAVQNQPVEKSCALMRCYRPPFDWSALLDYFRARTIDSLEKVAGEVYQRSFCINGHQGWLSLQNVPDADAVRMEVYGSDLSRFFFHVMTEASTGCIFLTVLNR